MYDMKALYEAKSVQDAVALRLAYPQAPIIAGGSDVLVQMREGKRAGVELTGPDGVRREPIGEFYIKAGTVDIRPGEIQTAILIPRESYENTYGHYIKYAMRSAMDIATLGTSVNLRLSANKRYVERARIAFGVAGPVPLRARTAEAAANGQLLTEELAERFAQAVREDIQPRDSWRAAKDFRMHIAVESAKRAFLEAAKLAGGVL